MFSNPPFRQVSKVRLSIDGSKTHKSKRRGDEIAGGITDVHQPPGCDVNDRRQDSLGYTQLLDCYVLGRLLAGFLCMCLQRSLLKRVLHKREYYGFHRSRRQTKPDQHNKCQFWHHKQEKAQGCPKLRNR